MPDLSAQPVLITGLRKSRLTDVYVLRPEQVSDFLDESAICQTAPLLAVEVVSPDSVTRDYRYKRAEYAALEIPEYWIVDPPINFCMGACNLYLITYDV